MRDLIIGMGDDTPQHRDATFMRSVELLNLDCDVHLFHSDPLPWHPVVDRWKLIADYLEGKEYRYVIACDTFDVVFQSDPFDWLGKNLGSHGLVVVSEEKTFSECEGNKRGMLQSFPEFYEPRKDLEILNAGVVAGKALEVAVLSEAIYNLCQQDVRLPSFTPGFEDRLPDQQALNIICPRVSALIAHGKDAWAFQYNHKHTFRDGLMYNEDGKPYVILHQYLYEWGDAVRSKYGT